MKRIIYLSIRYMKNQKGRTLSLIIGVALAVMLVFSLNVVPETQSKIETEKAYETYGDYHVEYNNLEKNTIDKIKNEKNIRDMYSVVNLGNLINQNGISMSLDSYNKEFVGEYCYKLLKGDVPKNEHEIVLESKALEEMGLDDSLNKEINFTIEKQYKDENGKNKLFNKECSLKLVGIISKPKEYYKDYEYHQLKAFTFYKEGSDSFIPKELIKYGGVLSFNTKAPQMNKMYEIQGKYGLSESDFTGNVGLIQTLNIYDTSETTSFDTNNKLLPMFAAVLVIYNIFNMILVDMTNQIGILKAIGASKKHIRTIVLVQSLIVLLAGIIVGLLLGMFLSYIGLAIIYKGIISLYISKTSLFEPIAMASVTVLLASIVPIYKCAKISPIEAIRKTNKSKYKQKNRFYHKLIRKIFGVTGEMAYKNVWRNKVTTMLSVLAISLGGGLYIRNMAFYNDDSSNEKTSMQVMSMGDKDINLIHNRYNVDNSFAGYTNEDLEKVSQIDNIKSIEASTSLYGFLKPGISNLRNEYIKFENISQQQKVLETNLWIQGYDENSLKEFDKYIEKGTTSLNKSTDKYPNALVYNHFYSDGNNEKEILKELKLEDLLTTKIPVIKDGKKVYEDVTVKVAGILNRDWGKEREIGDFSSIQVIVPQDALWKIAGRDTYNKISMKIKDGSDKEVHKDLEEIFKNEPYKEIESKYKYNQYYEKQEVELKRVVLLTVSLVLIISSLNILCTIKTNLLIRTNEFATLRAIGMSMKKLKSMIIKEAIIYGLLGSIIAGIVGIYDHYKFVSMVNKINESGFGIKDTMAFNVPILPIIQYMSVCILICIIAVLLTKKKIEKLSIVEGLRVND